MSGKEISPTRNNPTLIKGQVIATFGRQFEVKTSEGLVLICYMRGKKGGVACGDQVEILPITPGQGVIESVLPRTNLFYRSDSFRQKLIAANVTQLIIVVAVIPSFSETLIDHYLVAAENEKIKVLIVLNKCDLSEKAHTASEKLALYQQLGYPCLSISAAKDIKPLIPYLHQQKSLLIGQSGMGKSTIINALIPEAQRATMEISLALDSGRHTTTHARLYYLDAASTIIDSPGMQEFGIHHIDKANLARGFIEFLPYLGGSCKFSNCRHLSEPGCALLLAAEKGEISARRLMVYQKLMGEAERRKEWLVRSN